MDGPGATTRGAGAAPSEGGGARLGPATPDPRTIFLSQTGLSAIFLSYVESGNGADIAHRRAPCPFPGPSNVRARARAHDGAHRSSCATAPATPHAAAGPRGSIPWRRSRREGQLARRMRPGIAGAPRLVGSRSAGVAGASLRGHGAAPPHGPQQLGRLSPVSDTPQHPEAFCPPASLDISTRGYRSLRPWTLGLGAETRHPQQPLRRREKHGSLWEPGGTSRPRPVAPLVTSRQVHEAGQVSRGASCFACARRRNTSRGRAACAARSGPCEPTRNGQMPLAVGMVAAAAERGRALGDPRPGGPAPWGTHALGSRALGDLRPGGAAPWGSRALGSRALGDPRPGGPAPRGPAPLQSPLRAEDRLVFLPPQMLR